MCGEADIESAVWDHDATPVCWNCLAPYDPLQHQCVNCGFTVGHFTPYIPFVSIPFNYSFFDRLWTRLWLPVWESAVRRSIYLFVLILGAAMVDAKIGLIPILGTLLWWRYVRRLPSPGQCPNCLYDLRAGHLQCPECGTPVLPESQPFEWDDEWKD